MSAVASSPKVARPYIGGQAVLEGVMMRAPTSFAVVVRRKDGSLLVRERGMPTARVGYPKWPLVRGVVSLVESLRLGMEAIRFSSDLYIADLEAEEARSKGPPRPGGVMSSALRALTVALLSVGDGAPGAAAPPGAKDKKGGGAVGLVMLVLVVGLFVALPQAATAGVNRALNLGLEVQSPGSQAITGFFKLVIVVSYMLLLRRVPDFRRMFQFHGAEHKTISTYEAEEELVLSNARPKTTLHPRCGTTFLVMVALVSILVFTVIGGALPHLHSGSAIADNLVFFIEKLPFLPVIVALTFEIQRVFARHCTTGPLRALLWPGFLVQKITTIEPDDSQLEVALAALRATLFRETADAPSRDCEPVDVAFPSYDALAAASQLRPVAAAPGSLATQAAS
jgi:uncharacterized protein YqhQ